MILAYYVSSSENVRICIRMVVAAKLFIVVIHPVVRKIQKKVSFSKNVLT